MRNTGFKEGGSLSYGTPSTPSEASAGTRIHGYGSSISKDLTTHPIRGRMDKLLPYHEFRVTRPTSGQRIESRVSLLPGWRSSGTRDSFLPHEDRFGRLTPMTMTPRAGERLHARPDRRASRCPQHFVFANMMGSNSTGGVSRDTPARENPDPAKLSIADGKRPAQGRSSTASRNSTTPGAGEGIPLGRRASCGLFLRQGRVIGTTFLEGMDPLPMGIHTPKIGVSFSLGGI